MVPIEAGFEGVLGYLRPGAYTLRLALADGRIVEKPFTIVAGQPAALTVP